MPEDSELVSYTHERDRRRALRHWNIENVSGQALCTVLSKNDPLVSLLLKTTPFHRRTFALSQSHAWRRWAGYLMASSYELSHEREYSAIRSAAALFDVTPLYKYHVTGADAATLLDRVVTRDIVKCDVGQVVYTPWCDGAGKVLDDGTVARLDDRFFRLTSAEPSLRWLRMNAAGLDVEVDDVSDRIAALSVQGPTSRELLEHVGAAVDGLKYFRLTRTEIGGVPVTITRTGYTGDLGFELWLDNGHAEPLWDRSCRPERTTVSYPRDCSRSTSPGSRPA